MLPPDRPTTASFPKLVRADDFDPEKEPTVPGSDVVVSNATLYRLMQRLNGRLTMVAIAVVVQAAAVLLFGLLMWWSR